MTLLSYMNVARGYHGCTTFMNGNITLLVVAGGWTDDRVSTSVETLELSYDNTGQSWKRAVISLPTPRWGLTLVTSLSTEILCLGGKNDLRNYEKSVLSWSGDDSPWQMTSHEVSRYHHTAVVVPLSC